MAASCVDSVEMGLHGVSQILSLQLGLDLFVDVQLEWVGLPIILHQIQMLADKIIVKAPGKVLIAGGYGVLEEGNVGLSLAVDKYFYSLSSRVPSPKHEQSIEVHVDSPQIKQSWRYTFTCLNKQIKEAKGFQNPFLQNAIKYSLIYAYQKQAQIKASRIEITVLQDRGFLSQDQKGRKQKFICYDQESTKTGLGSSAAVIVVTVQAILRQLGQPSKQQINAVSQVANLSAQNKIGSNFDISTAVFGSHLYTNTLPSTAYKVSYHHNFQTLLAIDPQVKPVEPACEEMRSGYCCMIDLRQGSNTRKMVSGFVKALFQQSPQIVREFHQRSKHFVQQIYSVIASQSDLALLRSRLKALNWEYRKFIQHYSEISQIGVEPYELKPFLNCLLDIQTVFYAICPGSGGYDAIFVLSSAHSPQQVRQLTAQINGGLDEHGIKGVISDLRVVWREECVDGSDIAAINQFLQ